MPRQRRAGWPAFTSWAFAFALLLFAVLTGFSIGVFVFPLAMLAFGLAGHYARPWPELVSGGLAGIASVSLLVAFLNRDWQPCPAVQTVIHLEPGSGGRFSCGGLKPLPWLIVGLALLATSVIVHLSSRRVAAPTDRKAAT
jgi:hypothetical protein